MGVSVQVLCACTAVVSVEESACRADKVNEFTDSMIPKVPSVKSRITAVKGRLAICTASAWAS